MNRLVLATGNAGKLNEFRALLVDAGVSCIAQAELGVEDVEETGLTFIENALLKARHASRASGLPALADDSGLCVDALGGAPGLRSARYAGTKHDPAANIAKLLEALDGVPPDHRGAQFHAAIVMLRHPDDPRPLIAEGTWAGRILRSPHGDGGFGYDPVFLDLASGLSAAQLPPARKNLVSHRGQALARLRAAWPIQLAAH